MRHYAFLAAPFLLLFLVQCNSFLDNCSYDFGKLDNVATGHADWNTLCTQSLIDKFWNDFTMGQDDNWDQGFGQDNPCDPNYPLGRTFMSMLQLNRLVNSQNNQSGWYYHYASSNIQELSAACNDYGYPLAKTQDWWPNRHTTVFMPFFYELSVLEQGGVLVHEARHAEAGKHHINACPPGSNGGGIYDPYSVDINYTPFEGAFFYEVNTEMDFARQHDFAPALRAKAGVRANNILAEEFCTEPGFRLPPSSYCPSGTIEGRGADSIYDCIACSNNQIPDVSQTKCLGLACSDTQIPDVSQTKCVDCPPGLVSNSLTGGNGASCVPPPCAPNEYFLTNGVKGSPGATTTSGGVFVCVPCDGSIPGIGGVGYIPDRANYQCVPCPDGQQVDSTGSKCE